MGAIQVGFESPAPESRFSQTSNKTAAPQFASACSHQEPMAPLTDWSPTLPLGVLSPPARPPVAPQGRAQARCVEKGCVFPARGTSSRCLHHERQLEEPALYESFQPTSAVVDRGKFGVPNEEPDDSRFRDRKRLASQREAFLDD